MIFFVILAFSTIANGAIPEANEVDLWRKPGESWDSTCVPFERYENMSRDCSKQAQDLARLEERQRAFKLELDLQKAVSDAKITNIQALKDNCDLRIKFVETNATQTAQKLNECLSGTKTCYHNQTIRSDIKANLVHTSTGSYFVSQFKLNWHLAGQVCKTYGMDLLSIETKEENDELVKILVSGNFYWTSLTDLGSEGSFYWATTGKPLLGLYSNWDANQPDNAGSNEHCIHYWDSKGKNDFFKVGTFVGGFNWNDIPCDMQLLFICEALGPISQ